MKEIRYYVSVGRNARTRGDSYWPLPKDDLAGEWKLPRERTSIIPPHLRLYTTSGLLRTRQLSERIYRAEYREEPVKLPEPPFGTRRGPGIRWIRPSIAVREARLCYRLPTWGPHTARRFACECAERALNAVQAYFAADGRSHPQVVEREAVAFGFRLADKYQQVIDEFGSDLARGELRLRAIAGSSFGTPNEKAEYENWEEEYRALDGRLEKLLREPTLTSLYVTKAVSACLHGDVHEAAFNARNSASGLELCRMGARYPADEQLQKQRQARMDDAWESELAWQAKRLETLLADSE